MDRIAAPKSKIVIKVVMVTRSVDVDDDQATVPRVNNKLMVPARISNNQSVPPSVREAREAERRAPTLAVDEVVVEIVGIVETEGAMPVAENPIASQILNLY